MSTALDGFMGLLFVLFLILVGAAFWVGLDKEILIALLTAMLSVLGLIYSSSKNAAQQSQARLFSEKAELYKEIFGLFSDQIKAIRRKDETENSNSPSDELVDKIADLKSQMLIWGSEETIKTWLKIEEFDPAASTNPREIFTRWGNLYTSMRKDLGHNDVRIDGLDLISMFLNKEGRDELSR